MRDALLMTLLVGVVGFCAVYGIWWTSTRMIEQGMRAHLGELVKGLAVNVDPELHKLLKDPKQIDGPDYVKAVTPLRRAKAALKDVKYIYTVVRDEQGTVRFVLDAADPLARTPDGKLERSGVWEAYPDADSAMLRALGEGGKPGEAAVTSTPHKDDWGTFVSGYEPIIGADGKQVGVLGLDQDATEYMAALWRVGWVTWLGAIPGAIAAVGLGAMTYRSRRRLHLTLAQALAAKAEADAANRGLLEREATIRQLYERSEAALSQAKQAKSDAEQARAQAEQARAQAEQAKADAERSKAESERANRAKSEFLKNMSHEIRTPLTAILGYTDILEHEVNEEVRRHTVSTIKLAGKHLLSLVNDLLDLSKVEAGQLQLEMGEVNVPAVVDEVVAMMRPRAKAKNLVVTARGEGKLPVALVSDVTRVRQVLTGLMSNGVKFTEQGGLKIWVSASPKAGPVGTYDRERETEITIDVEDTGIGMTEEESGRIFKVFSQVDASQTRKVGGAGMGLVLSRKLAELLGGTVTLVRSQAGKGSVFRFTMRCREPAGTPWIDWQTAAPSEPGRAAADKPARAPAEAVTQATPPSSEDTPLTGRVLIVEDSPDTQRLLAFHLRKMGLQVDMSDDGQDALDLLQGVGRDAYVLVITDMQMPRMDGYTLVKEARRLGWQTPFVALTAHAMVEDKQRCLSVGCDAYATKPIDAAGLRKLCREWIGKRSTWGTLAAA